MPNISRGADENPLLVIALGAHLSKVRAECVLDHVVRDLRESAIVISTYARDGRYFWKVQLTST
jgi:hypothetical protein